MRGGACYARASPLISARAPFLARQLPRAVGLGLGVLAVVGGARLWRSDPQAPATMIDLSALVIPVDHPGPRALVPPTGRPPTLSCDEAKKVVAQAREQLAGLAPAVAARHLATGTIDWIDPHGLWSASPDSPVGPLVRERAAGLLAELDGRGEPDCPVAKEIGRELATFTAELRGVFQRAREGATGLRGPDGYRVVALPAFEDGKVTEPAHALAADLGRRVGAARATYGEELAPYASAALERLLPSDVPWDEVVLAAAVRAYLPQIDPHGGWAPLDEETSLYDVGLEASPPPRLWRKMSRTALGVRVEETGVEGLRPGDVVLRAGGIATAGLSTEQAEQLSYVDADPDGPARVEVVVLSPSDPAPRTAILTLGGEPSPPPDEGSLTAEIVAYGAGHVLVVGIPEIGEPLFADLAATLHRAQADTELTGLLLDLRGNGGGSVDGAVGGLSMFLPGTRVITTRRRTGELEVDETRVPDVRDRWDGPLAVLVDGDTASAAEMVAGSLVAYRRAVLLGDRTFGKGCAQEYLEDSSRSGVLKLTTLLYALPDGAPVQLAGVAPQIRLGMDPPSERESSLLHALSPWRGPDVRTEPKSREVAWPPHRGEIGPCRDATVCRALRAVGMLRSSAARGR